MKTKLAAAIVVSMLSACPQMPGVDGGSGGGGATGGGGGGATGGGSATGGGNATGGGSSGPFDAGRLNCTFEAPTLLGDGSEAQVAVTATGEAIYAWNDPTNGLRWLVQSPTGTRGTVQNDMTAGLVVGVGLVASGDRALLVSGSTTPSLQARRYSGGTWSAPESVSPTPLSLSSLIVGLEPGGAASIWRQDSFNASPWFEVTSDGTSAFSSQHQVADGGFLYTARRVGGTRAVVSLKSFSGDLPEALVSTSAGDTRTPLTGSVVTGSDYFHAAIADDGTVIIAGTFNLSGTDGVGAMVRTGGTLGAAQMVSVYADGGMSSLRTLGVLAGPGGLGAVVWLNDQDVFISRRTGTTWSSPQIIATTDGVIPRFSQLTGSRGLVHYYDATSAPKLIEVAADGFLGTASDSQLSGAIFGTEYAGAGAKAAAIATRLGADGGYVVYASQCR